MDYLKSLNIDATALIVELHRRNPDGSYIETTKIIGPYTFKTEGHFAQCVYLYAKKNEEDDTQYKYIHAVSDH